MPYSYYNRLSKSDQAIYRRSVAVASVKIPDVEPLIEQVQALQNALEGKGPVEQQRIAVSQIVVLLLDQLCQQLRVPRVKILVMDRRPRSSTEELYALYLRGYGKPPRIKIWMQTARTKKVVAFRTFMRTLIHEVCHHLDYDLLDLGNSFHTEGFFKRESSLFDQLMPVSLSRPASKTKPKAPLPSRIVSKKQKKKPKKKQSTTQLGLL